MTEYRHDGLSTLLEEFDRSEQRSKITTREDYVVWKIGRFIIANRDFFLEAAHTEEVLRQ